MERRLEVEDVVGRHPLPPRPTRGLDDRGQTFGKQGPAFAKVDHVEDDALVLLRVLHREVEPEPEQKRSRNKKKSFMWCWLMWLKLATLIL